MARDNWKNRGDGIVCNCCMFYVPKEKPDAVMVSGYVETSIGRCRRHAPTLEGYPAVYISDWCGDHKMNTEHIMVEGADISV